MKNDQWWSMATQVRARTRGQNASSRGRKENWSAEVIHDYLMSRVGSRVIACLLFANFRPRLNSGLQEYKGNKVPTYRIIRAQGSSMSLFYHDWMFFLPQTLSTKGHIFSCFRDGGKRFDAEFQGSHHQLDKQTICHIWYQNENKGVKWTKWMYNPRWSGFCGGSWETSSKPNLWSFAGSSKDLS